MNIGKPDLVISGPAARTVILNTHAIVRHKYRGMQLWVLVRDITGHGSGYSWEICMTANLDPGQKCGGACLADLSP